jgi:hypothetical protein
MYAADHFTGRQDRSWTTRLKHLLIMNVIGYCMIRLTRLSMGPIYWTIMALPYLGMFLETKILQDAKLHHDVSVTQFYVMSYPDLHSWLYLAVFAALILYLLGTIGYGTAGGMRAVIWYAPVLAIPCAYFYLGPTLHYAPGNTAYLKQYYAQDCSQQHANLVSHGNVYNSDGTYAPCTWTLSPGAPLP